MPLLTIDRQTDGHVIIVPLGCQQGRPAATPTGPPAATLIAVGRSWGPTRNPSLKIPSQKWSEVPSPLPTLRVKLMLAGEQTLRKDA